MAVIESKLKKWGNSFGVVIPKELLKREHIGVNDKIALVVLRNKTSRAVFGSAKNVKLSGQDVKNLARRELHHD